MKKFLKFIGLTKDVDYYDRILYFLLLCTISVAALFMVFYVFLIPFPYALIAHATYLSLSILLYIPLKHKHYNFVRYCILSFHLVQLSLSVFLWFPYDTGFNIYYFMIPMSAFIVMRYANIRQRIFAIVSSLLASSLFLISEVFPNNHYLFETSSFTNSLFTGTSLATILIPMIFIFAMMARSDYYINKELKNLADKDSLTRFTIVVSYIK